MCSTQGPLGAGSAQGRHTASLARLQAQAGGWGGGASVAAAAAGLRPAAAGSRGHRGPGGTLTHCMSMAV